MSDLPDLRTHGIIEAHAGTGKTYTIVRMVLELLVRERLELRQILLVTFTQKAAGELLERIRQGIAEARSGCDDPHLSAHLQRCLGQLGECWIGTIHGVALRILRAWPFESGLPFRTELVDDGEGLEAALREVWRRDPWKLDGTSLASLVEGKTIQAWMVQALDLARGRLDPDMVLLPEGADRDGAWESLAGEEERLRQDVGRCEAALRDLEARFVEWLRPLAQEFLSLSSAALTKAGAKSKENVDASWRQILSERAARSEAAVLGLPGRTRKTLADNLSARDLGRPEGGRALEIWDDVRRRWSADVAPSAGDWQAAREGLEGIESRRRAVFLASWATTAAREWKARKAAEGLLSYQDMLERLRDALSDPGFRSVLRGRIRVGVIDEFQDTSALQWDIFRTWFLSGDRQGAGRLFLVGDPKQSIYSFQGADVRTYLRACRDLEEAGARRFPLRRNWRSTPGVVEAVNGLLTGVPDWFGTEIVYDAGSAVETPSRADDAPDAEGPPSALAVPLEGPAATRRARYASFAAGHIPSLRGTVARLPKGDRWTERALDWGDFAVVVQTRNQVASFRRAFRRAGIPWALYKEQGVFASRAAREFRALLAALVEPPDRQAMKRRAALTRFFGLELADLDASTDLSEVDSTGGVLERLSVLASEGRWARLFHAIRRETGVESRLLRGEDGDRHWMDLRQTMEHALEFLVSGKGRIPELVEHLGRLERGDESAAEDRNLHARATDRDRVQILTMHVSKGLEFPVVFLATAPPRRSGPIERWIGEADGRLRLHMAPRAQEPRLDALEQATQEEARLLYVALTRPKLQVVVPVHKVASPAQLDLLSRRLEDVSFGSVAGRAEPPPSATAARSETPAPAFRGTVGPERVAALGLRERVRVLSSYSAISRSTADHALSGRLRPSEEPAEAADLTESVKIDAPDSWLPRGAAAGDALHEILESCLRRDDLSWIAEPALPERFLAEVRRILRLHALPEDVAPRVAALVARILSSPLDLPTGARVALRDLPPADRRPELEFHCAVGNDGRIVVGGRSRDPGPRGWLVGYIDLLFRHEGTWFVLDWKTTTLPDYGPEALERGMDEHDYRLQAALYTAVLERSGLGRCGGAVYVFLRAAADGGTDAATEPLPGVWGCLPSGELESFAHDRLRSWLGARRNAFRGDAA